MTNEERYKKWVARDFSWSQISSFEYSPEQWYRSYWLGEKDPPSEEMKFGSWVGKQLETNADFLPMIRRRPHMEYKFRVQYGKRWLVGYADSFCEDTPALEEYKTGVKAWDQKRVDDHGQIDMYLFMRYLATAQKPEDFEITLWWMPTTSKRKFEKETGDLKITVGFVDNIEENIKSFSTKRTMNDLVGVDGIAARITRTWKEMEEYAMDHE